jgi:hypothetical protein
LLSPANGADEAVLQYNQMLALSKPQNRNLDNLQEWMRRPTMGRVYLAGLDRNVWSDGSDMIALENHKQEIDNFSEWLLDCLRSFHYQCGRRLKVLISTKRLNFREKLIIIETRKH